MVQKLCANEWPPNYTLHTVFYTPRSPPTPGQCKLLHASLHGAAVHCQQAEALQSPAGRATSSVSCTRSLRPSLQWYHAALHTCDNEQNGVCGCCPPMSMTSPPPRAMPPVPVASGACMVLIQIAPSTRTQHLVGAERASRHACAIVHS
jgi:hypothetical protein